MKRNQLKNLIKEIVRTVNSTLVAEKLTTRAELDTGVMHAVNVEENQSSSQLWQPVGNGVFRISDTLAQSLSKGQVARPGYETLVPAPKGFPSTKGFVWLSQKMGGGTVGWFIKDSKQWVMKGGKVTIDPTEEQSVSGGAGGYQTPFAFKKKTKVNEIDNWEAPREKRYANIGEWAKDNIDEDGIYKGEPLANYGFPYKVGEAIPLTRYHLYSALHLWNNAKKKRNDNLRLGKPLGMNEDLGIGAGLAIGAAGLLIWKVLKKIVSNIAEKHIPISPRFVDAICSLAEKYVGEEGGLDDVREEVEKLIKNGSIRTIHDFDKYMDDKLKKAKEKSLDEQSVSGDAGGYQTPFAFTKNKSGSKRALDVTTKMGFKKVGEAPRV